jgi:hypothetical protein
MPYLERFTPDERELLVSLPYRVGLWVSQSDNTGGTEASAAEMQALENIVMAFAEDFCKSEFVEEIMRQTMQDREKWPHWQRNIESLPADCTRAVDIVAEKMERKDVTSFKHNLMDIAVDVAMAFCETDYSQNLYARFSIYSRYFVEKLKARIKKVQPPSLDAVLNISKAEQAALKVLDQALRMETGEGLEPQPLAQAAV